MDSGLDPIDQALDGQNAKDSPTKALGLNLRIAGGDNRDDDI